jgi:DNA-directed RNA polymerase II subunit RPB1
MFNKNKIVPPAKIIGIQFSLLSTDEKRNSSVAEITKKETITNGLLVTGGLLDSRMGVLDRGKICPTDGLDYMQSPGYNGHIELAKPVFYTQYLPQIIQICKCVCFVCCKLLIDKNKYSYLLDYSPTERLKIVRDLCKTVQRCGMDADDECGGCGCIQPSKIIKEGLANLTAQFIVGEEKREIQLTPEVLLQKFKRISDDDIVFMGYHPKWARPQDMICEVFLVPPPAVRPSVKMNAQQRSEDDLTHILAQIVRANNALRDKMLNKNADKNRTTTLQTYWNNLQHYIHCFVNNNSPNVPPMTQRTGRPLKSIQSRLNGKTGRMRGNLMAKRVDFSARSVITADPNISIRELGIPLKIAKKLTKPVVVNERNLEFMTKLVQNGPNYPGATFLENENGTKIRLHSLSDEDRVNLTVRTGDVVHRNMLDGDRILFNRQPSLHKMSMMCHVAKIMYVGETFRMNVADTKPYNADFDGDEMNLHMPQLDDAMVEIQELAAVPYQIISPGSNKPIIGIFQDNMVGASLLTRSGVMFNKQTIMNMLMMYNKLDPSVISEHTKPMMTSFDLLSQILPPLTLKVKNKRFKYNPDSTIGPNNPDSPEYNNIVEIVDGKYIRGQLDSGIMGTGTKGLIHRICNDFGNANVSDFIDDFQNIVTDYIKLTGFSVGVSDLILEPTVKVEIVDKMTEIKIQIKNYIDKVRLGLVENLANLSIDEYEAKIVNQINQINKVCGSIGIKSLLKKNRFLEMADSGSKGSALNIQQMVCFVGAQDINGRRITNGFDGRTLPHFTKYDDSIEARGFIQSSYIDGLNPQEMFFHAMAGRIGLIDTAVKTSTTGYIQRKIIKGMEDLMVGYDMLVRNNKKRIVQFSYGEDSIDTVRVENQEFPLMEMSIQDIYVHFNIPVSIQSDKKDMDLFVVFENSGKDSTLSRYKSQLNKANERCKYYTDYMIQKRDEIVRYVFNYNVGNVIRAPVAFTHLINNIRGQFKLNSYSLVDITMLEAFELLEETYIKLESILLAPPTEMFKVLYYFFLSPRELLFNQRFNRFALVTLLENIVYHYKKSIVAPGEMVGLIAAQSIGEPTTQLTLNTFHFAGVSSKGNVTRGVPRVEEIMATSMDSNMKNPAMTIYLKPEYELMSDKAKDLANYIVLTKMSEIVSSSVICYDVDPLNPQHKEDTELIRNFTEFEQFMSKNADTDDIQNSKWVVRLEMNREIMYQKNITMDDVHFALSQIYAETASFIYADYNADKLIFRINLNKMVDSSSLVSGAVHALDVSDHINYVKTFQHQLLNHVVLRGIPEISEASVEKKINNYENDGGTFKKKDVYTVQTTGSNLMTILGMEQFVDSTKTFTNDIVETYHVLGLEAARQTIYNELTEVFEFTGSGYLNYHHTSLFCDRMTYTYKILPYSRNGTNNDDIGPIAKASFEMTPEMFLRAARHGELDIMRGVSANVMCGQNGYFGTNVCQVMLDMDAVQTIPPTTSKSQNLAKQYADVEMELNGEDACAAILKHSAVMENTIDAFNTSLGEMGDADNDYELF